MLQTAKFNPENILNLQAARRCWWLWGIFRQLFGLKASFLQSILTFWA